MKNTYVSVLEGLSSKKNEAALGTEVGLPIDKENCEATDASMVSTPKGKLNKPINKILCPECNSDNVNIYDDSTMHCVDCDHKWKPSSEDFDEEGEKDSLIEDNTNESVMWYGTYVSAKSKETKGIIFQSDSNDFEEAEEEMDEVIPEPYTKLNLKGKCSNSMIKDLVDNSGYKILEISSLFTKYAISSKFTKTALKDYIFNTYNKRHAVSNPWGIAKTGKDRYEVEIGTKSYDVSDFPDIHKVYNEAKIMGYILEHTTYKSGKRYRTDDNMYFVVKKVYNDGTVLVYDEDIEKEYKAEISDLELLNPVMVKESVDESASSAIDKLNNLECERGISKVGYNLIKQYEFVLREFPIGTVLSHKMDAGTEKFTKTEDGDYGWWEHLRMPWKETQKMSEFDMARWLAGRGFITRGKIELEK